MSASDEKAKLLAQEYVASIERQASFDMDDDLQRIVKNTYATAYLRGSVDAIEDHLALHESQMQALLARIAELEAGRGN